MRAPSDTDFVLPVEGIGNFTFAKKNMRIQMAIECEYARLTEGIETVTPFLHVVSTALSNLAVLTVAAPPGWDLEELDPEDSDSYEKLLKVWGVLREKQATFRKGAADNSAGAGAGAGEKP
jgi:hypothetical protein